LLFINAVIGEIVVSDTEVKFTTNQAIYQQIYILFNNFLYYTF